MTGRLAVIGGGAAGLGAALAARRRGADVVLIERDRVGGDCTWTGCVPSKALLDRAREVAGARRQGFEAPADSAGVLAAARRAVEEVAADESPAVLERLGVEVRQGQARFTRPGRVAVDGQAVAADAVVLATGAHAAMPAVPGLADAAPLTHATVFDLPCAPGRMAVLGGGPTGVELAQAFARLGSHVTLLEAADRLLPTEEADASRVLAGALAADGIDVRTGARVTAVSRGGAGTRVEVAGDEPVDADHLLVATGRAAATDGLALDRAGVATDARGFVATDARLATTGAGVWAAGDVTGGAQLTHVAYDQGARAADNALSRRARRFDDRVVPRPVFTDPEVARVGLTEAEAAAAHGGRARVATVALRRTDRGRIAGRSDGYVRLIAAPWPIAGRLGGGRLVGATIVAPPAADLIAECALAMRARMFAGRLAQTSHAYPSWSLAVRQAAAQLFRAEAGGRARPPRAG